MYPFFLLPNPSFFYVSSSSDEEDEIAMGDFACSHLSPRSSFALVMGSISTFGTIGIC